MQTDDAVVVEVQAFPQGLAAAAMVPIAELAKEQIHSVKSSYQVRLRGEQLAIPVRVYYKKEQVLKYLDGDGLENMVAMCLGSRHFDGFVREKCLRRLLALDAYWVAPFVMQMLGEYVVEIVLPIEEALSTIETGVYADFLIENPKYFGTTERRAISYWSAYYRDRYPELCEYPAMRAIETLKLIVATTAAARHRQPL